MVAGRVQADPELVGDALAVDTGRHQVQHLPLPLGQRNPRAALLAREVPQRPDDDQARQDHLAGCCQADRAHDVVEPGRLEQVPGGTDLHRSRHRRIARIRGQDDDRRLRSDRQDPRRKPVDVAVREMVVGQDHLRTGRYSEPDPFRDGARTPDDLDVARARERRSERLSQRAMIFHEQHADHRGSSRMNAAPCPMPSLSARILPPWASAMSRT